MKKLLIFMFVLILVSFASAQQQSFGFVKQNDCIEIIQTCPDCTYNNISRVLYPNKTTIALSNVAMDKDDTYYNYTFCSTSALGNYIVNGYGDLGGTKTSWVYDFEVTTTGKQSNLPIPIFLLIASVTLFITGIILKSPPFGFFAGVLFVIVGMYMMIYGFGDIADLYTQALALVTLGFGSIIMILAGFSWMDEYEET
ncbi:hypothetical protein LCGC14_1712310 [marine sediment metagenome]|uniref:Uncharacterized protein n=1 Tax=marine sediment metagenome TaxID=412755 RepID=A0A0F9I2B7_9ZZZZ|nr:hypothetical protein [archaeon]